MIAPEDLVAAILPHLEGLKGPSGTGNYEARCPLHDDRHASFSLHATTGLWICHAGSCGRKGNSYQLAEELGCLPDAPAPTRRRQPQPLLTVDWGLDAAMRRYGIHVHDRGVIFPVYDDERNRCRYHVRLHEGEPRFQYWGRGRTYHALVDWPLVREWGKGCGIAYVVEGDRDWLCLAAHGWPAIGILGIEHFGKAREEAFGHIREAGIGAIVVTPDNDAPGMKAAREWAESLRAAGFVVGIRRLPDEVKGRTIKDLFDLFQAVGTDFEEWMHLLPVWWIV